MINSKFTFNENRFFDDNKNVPHTSIRLELKEPRLPNKLYYNKEDILSYGVIYYRKKTEKVNKFDETNTKNIAKKLERSETDIVFL